MVKRLKSLVMGKPLNPEDPNIFHKISLIAFFAWVGLGADALSSSSYGPAEAFLALGKEHVYLAIFVALGTAATIYIIGTSYSHIVELFPNGGGGYLVASKLLSPGLGMLSGCALLIDYVMTITLSIASGVEALFSFLPPELRVYQLACAIAGILILIVLNLRGVKESVLLLAPIFLMFVITHLAIIGYALVTHAAGTPQLAADITVNAAKTTEQVGLFGLMLLLLRSYSMGAGTYTGLEAVSNGMPILREPKVQTAKKTMKYMAASLIFMVLGLMTCYLLYEVGHEPGKTLNAVLAEKVTAEWGDWGYGFAVATLVSEALLLFVAAQTGFIDGPRVLANMSLDRWFPTRFATLSDRLVTHNGVLIMGLSALAMMAFTQGSVSFLVVLYSITVFLTFFLSQAGMVRYWWNSRSIVNKWDEKLAINGLGMTLTFLILVSMIAVKFQEGGWITLLLLAALIALVSAVRGHYNKTTEDAKKLDDIVPLFESAGSQLIPAIEGYEYDPKAKTAIVSVNGYNGMGVRTLSKVFKSPDGASFRNFVFIEVGVVDAAVFKGSEEVKKIQEKVKSDLEAYAEQMRKRGYHAETVGLLGVDVVDKIAKKIPEVLETHPDCVFFGGQIMLPKSKMPLQWLHSYTLIALEKRLREYKVPFRIVPINV